MLRGGRHKTPPPPTQDGISINPQENVAVAASGAAAARFPCQDDGQRNGRGVNFGHGAINGTARLPRTGWRRVAVGALREAITDQVALAAAGCGFYATLALFPAISMLISVYGLVFDVPSVEQQLAVMRTLLPPPAYTLIDDRVHELVSQPNDTLSISLIVSLIVAFWSASAGTKSVLSALNVAYDTVERRGILGFQLIALAMTLCAVAAAVLAIAVLVLLPTAISFVGLSDYSAALINAFSRTLLIVLVGGTIALLYRFGPSRPPPPAADLSRRRAGHAAVADRLGGPVVLRLAHREPGRHLRTARRRRRHHAVVLPDRLCRAARRRGECPAGTDGLAGRHLGWPLRRPPVT